MTKLEVTLAYAKKFPIFPVHPFSRIPLVKWGTEASQDPAQIETWWQRWPNACPAVPTGRRSGLVILDIDDKNGKNGFHSLELLGRSVLPTTPLSYTPHGGTHVWFAVHPSVAIRNSVGELGPGLDIRGDGGMVPLPCDGSGYRWDDNYHLDKIPLLNAPAWLGHRKPRPAAGPTASLQPQRLLDAACDQLVRAAAGQRHDEILRTVYSIAGLAATGALDDLDARHRLAVATLTMVAASGGDQKKAERDFNDAWRAGYARPWRRGR